MAATVNGAQRVQSVARAAELLKALRSPATVFELADRCGLNRSTAWRLLATLEDSGLVERDPETGRYAVGYALGGLRARRPRRRGGAGAARAPRAPAPARARGRVRRDREPRSAPRAAARV